MTDDDEGLAAILSLDAHRIQKLWDTPQPHYVTPAATVYREAGGDVRCALLALLGATGSREAAEAFLGCVREHGWPDRVYQRIFWELPKLRDHAHVLYPELWLSAGDSVAMFVDVGNAMVDALNHGALTGAQLAAAAGPITGALEANLDDAAARQQPEGVAWRFDDDYRDVRGLVGLLLDVTGHLPEGGLTLLRRAVDLADPWLAGFAATSLLRRGEPVDDAVLARVAADHETRDVLFGQLEALGQLARFPSGERTLDRFAAADMAQWLAHPGELGRLPDELELGERIAQDGAVLHVWRFRVDDGAWQAGVSGPYRESDGDRPVRGESTFSRFETWDARTPAGHAASVLATLADWARAR